MARNMLMPTVGKGGPGKVVATCVIIALLALGLYHVVKDPVGAAHAVRAFFNALQTFADKV